MDSALRRVLLIALLGAVVIAGVWWLREAGWLRSARARADSEFALSERAHHEGDFEGAMRHMQNAVKLDPHFVEAREGLAAMYEQHRGLDDAVAEYERGIKEDPQNEARYCYRIAEMYFVSRQWEPALKWLKRSGELDPDDFHVQRMMGFCLERLGRWQEAERHWSQMLTKNANSADVQRGLERVRRHLKNAKEQSGKGG